MPFLDAADPAFSVTSAEVRLAEDEWRTIAAESATVGLAMGVRIREHLPRIEAVLAALYDCADALTAGRRHDPRDDLVTGRPAVRPAARGNSGLASRQR